MSAPQYPQPPQYQPQPGYPPPVPVKKGLPVWAWVLIGGVTLAMVAVIGISIAAYMFAQKVMENPGAALAKIAAAANPDLDIIDVNDKTGKITVRDKKSGKTVTVDTDAIKNGRITIDSDEGHAELGTGADVKMPSWVYLPGDAKVIGGVTSDSAKGAGGSIVFISSQPIENLKAFFEDKYKGAGYDQNSASISKSNGQEGLQLTFLNEGRKRTVTIACGKTGEGASGTIIYAEEQ